MKVFFKLSVLLMMSVFFIGCDMTSSQKTNEEIPMVKRNIPTRSETVIFIV